MHAMILTAPPQRLQIVPTVGALGDIDIKHALKPLRPRHFHMLAHWRLCVLLALQVLLAIASLATFRRCHIDSMLAVWR